MIVGLTGGIASGKSTVSKTFRANGIPVVDADVVARQVVEHGTKGLSQIVSVFGTDILNHDHTLDRSKLGEIVFSDKQKMQVLNEIMAPLIFAESTYQLSVYTRDHPLVVWDAALIIESGHTNKYRPLIIVCCPKVVQIERLMRRNGLTERQAMDRISAQMPVEQKIKLADYLIDSSGTIEDSIRQTEVIINKLKEKQ